MPALVRHDRCIRCGNCVYICGKWIFRFDPQNDRIRRLQPGSCVHCLACQDLCPTGAITVVMPRTARRGQSSAAGQQADRKHSGHGSTGT